MVTITPDDTHEDITEALRHLTALPATPDRAADIDLLLDGLLERRG